MDAVDFYPGLPPGVKGVSKEFIYSIILSTFSDCFYFFTLMVWYLFWRNTNLSLVIK